MLLEFAEPLTYADPSGPPDIASFRSIMQLAEMCRKLPVFKESTAPAYLEASTGFERVLAAMPEQAARPLRQLLESRTTTFAAVPFLVTVDWLAFLPLASTCRSSAATEQPRAGAGVGTQGLRYRKRPMAKQ